MVSVPLRIRQSCKSTGRARGPSTEHQYDVNYEFYEKRRVAENDFANMV